MDFLADYGLFLLKAMTIVFAIIAVIGAAASAGRKVASQEGLEVEDLSKKYREMAAALKAAVSSKKERKSVQSRDPGQRQRSGDSDAG